MRQYFRNSKIFDLYLSEQKTLKDMSLSNPYIKERDGYKRFLINKVADMYGVSPRTVDRIINGESDNEEVFTTFMELREGVNFLLEAVNDLIPFESKKPKSK